MLAAGALRRTVEPNVLKKLQPFRFSSGVPLPSRRRRLLILLVAEATSARFNGAALIRARKLPILRWTWQESLALQWGRAHSSAEMSEVGGTDTVMNAASMGPRSFERGNCWKLGATMIARFQLQWGRAHSSAEMSARRRRFIARTKWLQWGRAHSSAEMNSITAVPGRFDSRLQWGRAHSSAEMGGRVPLPAELHAASMGPRSFERGNLASLRWRRAHLPGFNGAALIRARKCHKNPQEDRPSYLRFNGAALIRARKWIAALMDGYLKSQASMGPRSFERGNDTGRGSCEPGNCASMGPRSFERGNGRPERYHAQWVAGFNGAALIRARKLLHAIHRNLSQCGLQWGRAHSSAEIDGKPRLSGPVTPLLQWGRAHSSAEIAERIGISSRCDHASMGPRSFERGNHRILQMKPSGLTRFNGAALIRARKSDEGYFASLIVTRFNGAALIRARKCGEVAGTLRADSALQWGRAHSSAEIAPACRLGCRLPRASMGPRSFERGNKTGRP